MTEMTENKTMTLTEMFSVIEIAVNGMLAGYLSQINEPDEYLVDNVKIELKTKVFMKDGVAVINRDELNVDYNVVADLIDPSNARKRLNNG